MRMFTAREVFVLVEEEKWIFKIREGKNANKIIQSFQTVLSKILIYILQQVGTFSFIYILGPTSLILLIADLQHFCCIIFCHKIRKLLHIEIIINIFKNNLYWAIYWVILHLNKSEDFQITHIFLFWQCLPHCLSYGRDFIFYFVDLGRFGISYFS